MPHEYRHILGWYRLIQELRENDVRAICVFDGGERTLAKSNEQNRRRHIRRTDALRGEIESDRLRRLLGLTKGFNALRLLSEQERLLIMSSLRMQMSGFESQLVPKPDHFADPPPTDHYPRRDLSDTEPILARGEPTGFDDVNFDELHHEVILPVIVTPQETDVFGGQYSTGTEELDFHHFGQLSLSSSTVNQSEDRYDLVDRLAAADIELPEDYQEGDRWQGLACVPTTTISPTPLGLAPQELVRPAASQVQLDALSSTTPLPLHLSAMSKTQYQLAIQEGKFWEKLTGPEAGIDQNESPTATILSSLREKSCFMVQSYLRRNNPPTEITYEESKTILDAMGVPCIEPTGPYEAEALASSLVLGGFADYVASEDTDVLIYGAPLIRNITSREKALLLISGSDARSALQLDAAAFIDFALLLGTDFAPRIRNIGPHRALQYIRKYGTIERILAEEKQYVPRVPLRTYLQAVRDARNVFAKFPPVPALPTLEPKAYQEGEVATILGLHRLQRFLDPDAFLGTLEGNYFNDNPVATNL
ncbi:PIN domain-like protein [Multifurca ochricompacta]|uniref:PIN domain-like protein n=1 Tax=Multifurca ochricompacta TaxID=376703 RepID=A0AAD4QNX8_9AGAM|nr:PIN domain-like protein [Multifurca ochricompacta]